MNVAVVVCGPVTVQAADGGFAAVVKAVDVIVYPVGNPSISAEYPEQLVTTTKFVPINLAALFIAAAAPKLAATPFVAARAASFRTSRNLGTATAARMPKMTITITNSIKVKPDC